jgi:dGTPase
MDWGQLLSTKRLGAEEDDMAPRPGRTEFESDIDRLTFSSSFRRLGRKTQVHPLAANDHIHTRLTHSLEVSRVGKALGKELGSRLLKSPDVFCPSLPPEFSENDLGDIVQAACLAHDLGNPPFGHAGEEAIIHWFDQNRHIFPETLHDDLKHDLSSLEGNAQGFRIITQLENHLFRGGLRLTYATLGAFQKYPWTSRLRQKKFGAYISDEKILDTVSTELGIKKASDGRWCRHPLAYLVEAADDICYTIIDIEDAVELGILKFEDALGLLLTLFDDQESEKIRSSLASNKMHRVNFARLRGKVFDKTISGAIDAFIQSYSEIMEGGDPIPLFDRLEADDPRRKIIASAKRVGRENIYTDHKKVEIEIGCYATFDTLLKELCAAALHQAQVLSDSTGESKLSWKDGHVLRLLSDHAPSRDNAPADGWTQYQCLRRVIDFVSGMTDNYAIYIAKQLQGGGFAGVQRP